MNQNLKFAIYFPVYSNEEFLWTDTNPFQLIVA